LSSFFASIDMSILLQTVLHFLELINTIRSSRLSLALYKTREGVLELSPTRALRHALQTRTVPINVTVGKKGLSRNALDIRLLIKTIKLLLCHKRLRVFALACNIRHDTSNPSPLAAITWKTG
jgi:hypothetical protein